MTREGILPPAQSALYISEHSTHVKIHEEGLEKLSAEMFTSIKDKLEIPDTGANISYLSKDDPKAVDWIFVADALNFCFWSYTGAVKWTVDGHSGYYALEAALSRAVKEGIDITNPKYYSKITENQLRTIMRSDNEAEIPLFDKRLSTLHEVGTILLQKYNGTFVSCLKEANKSAVKLLQIIVDSFPCFRDEVVYKGTKVSLYKRAQILVADIWNFFHGTGWGEFKDIDAITMFADYRIPQVLVYFGVLSYSDTLMDKVKNDVLLESGSEEEVEIRGCSIQAVELLKKRIEDKIKNSKKDMEVPNSSVIDYYLWCYRRKYADELERIPFHKTLGIYY
ncbi:queuosine salvage protein [Galleria mellonella]|uniref:Queuosine 5'-phosphate N-glycosylase/hydrolase n=1 Tax=Galleria mellonella TaxID=7137 RepID=A0A6J1X025_GALME|nr:queuosine salvage protein [Galleria mellonella]XP_052748836.1 queuosine salvage protein [Galleria mellonella]XP_052748837.1 queuosine salvage protein [Galleria mellonella]